MIQRIQSIWLSLAAILSLLLLSGEILMFSGQNQEIFTLGLRGLTSVNSSNTPMISLSFLIPALLIIIPAVSILAIFLFRKRQVQKLAVIGIIIASAVLCLGEAYSWYIVTVKHNGILIPGIRMIIPAIIIILAVLAYLGIKKDENIVRSYDRLR